MCLPKVFNRLSGLMRRLLVSLSRTSSLSFSLPTITPSHFNRNKLQFQNNDYINNLKVMRVPSRCCDTAVGPVRLKMPLREREMYHTIRKLLGRLYESFKLIRLSSICIGGHWLYISIYIYRGKNVNLM